MHPALGNQPGLALSAEDVAFGRPRFAIVRRTAYEPSTGEMPIVNCQLLLLCPLSFRPLLPFFPRHRELLHLLPALPLLPLHLGPVPLEIDEGSDGPQHGQAD